MNILTAAVVLSLSTLVSVSGQSSIVGKWEFPDVEFSDELYVWEFRQDGILLQNEYYEGDLECVYAFQYVVSGERSPSATG
jgi:hypothetical protein